MESYQIIADIVENNIEEPKEPKEPYSFLFNIFECYNNDFLKKLTILNTERVEKDLTRTFVLKRHTVCRQIWFKSTCILLASKTQVASSL